MILGLGLNQFGKLLRSLRALYLLQFNASSGQLDCTVTYRFGTGTGASWVWQWLLTEQCRQMRLTFC